MDGRILRVSGEWFGGGCVGRLVLCVGVSGVSAVAWGQSVDVDVLAWKGQTLPDGSGVYAGFADPVLNDAGLLAGVVDWRPFGAGGTRSSLVQVGNDDRQVVARGNALAPGTGGDRFSTFDQPTQSEGGLVGFVSGLNAAGLEGIYRGGGFAGGGGVGVVEIARTDVALSGLNGGSLAFENGGGNVTLTESGRVGFTGLRAAGINVGAMYLGDGNGVEVLVRTESSADDLSGGVVAGLLGASDGFAQTPALNAVGEAAFAVRTGQNISPDFYVLRTDRVTGELDVAFGPGNPAYDDTQVVHLSGVAKSAAGTGVALNDAGQVVVELFDPTSSTYDLVRLDPTGGESSQDTVTVLADYGLQPLAGTDRVLVHGAQSAYALNNVGQTAFVASTRTGSASAASSEGLLLHDDLAGVLPVVLGGSSAPGGGTFVDVGLTSGFGSEEASGERFALNDAGAVAFAANVAEGAEGEVAGLFMWDVANGLREVVREGDAFLESTLVGFGFSGGTNERGSARSGLNEAGEVAFAFELADGRSGLAVWSVAASLAGDYNDSGAVEQGDLDLVLGNWGVDTSNDGSGNVRVPAGWVQDFPMGQVDQAELDVVLTGWGSSVVAPVIRRAVPEPGVVGLGVLLGGVLAGRRRCRR